MKHKVHFVVYYFSKNHLLYIQLKLTSFVLVQSIDGEKIYFIFSPIYFLHGLNEFESVSSLHIQLEM